MMKSLEALSPLLSLKGIPFHLEELRLVNCIKISSVITSNLLEALAKKSYVKRLSLVSAQINDDLCVQRLCKFI